jgi:hypothetical protein
MHDVHVSRVAELRCLALHVTCAELCTRLLRGGGGCGSLLLGRCYAGWLLRCLLLAAAALWIMVGGRRAAGGHPLPACWASACFRGASTASNG